MVILDGSQRTRELRKHELKQSIRITSFNILNLILWKWAAITFKQFKHGNYTRHVFAQGLR